MLLGRLYEAVPRFLRPIEFRLAQTVDEFKAAAGLVYQEYLKRRYLLPNAMQMKLSIYNVLPHTTTFVAVHHRAGVVATITLVEDSPLGLPMDEVYKAEVDALRRQGLRLAEATLLALNSELFGRGVFTMFHAKKLLLTLRLFKVLFDHLRSVSKADELVACFHPKHEILYDFLQLKPLGDLKTYASANGNPSIARHLNVSQTQRDATWHVAHRLFFGRPPSPRAFGRKLRFSPTDLRNLFVIGSPVLASASPTELRYVQSCYPTFNLNEILSGYAVPQPHIIRQERSG